MDHTRHRCDGATLNVGNGTGNRAGRRQTAEEGYDAVGNALSHQFLIGIMAFVGHCVGHACAKQRFDCAQQGQCNCRSEQLLDVAPADVRHLELRQSLRNTAEFRTDGFHRKVK